MKITIDGIASTIDGQYDLPDSLTNDEFRLIKREAGVRAGEFTEALVAGDNDLLVALAMIVLKREGKLFTTDMLWSAEAGLIGAKAEPEDDAGPPEPAPDSPESESGPTESS